MQNEHSPLQTQNGEPLHTRPVAAFQWLKLPKATPYSEATDKVKAEQARLDDWQGKIEAQRQELDAEKAKLSQADLNTDGSVLAEQAANLRQRVLQCLQDELKFRRQLEDYWPLAIAALRKRSDTLRKQLEKKQAELIAGLEKIGFTVREKIRNQSDLHITVLSKHPDYAAIEAKLNNASRPGRTEAHGGESAKLNREQIETLERQIRELFKKLSEI